MKNSIILKMKVTIKNGMFLIFTCCTLLTNAQNNFTLVFDRMQAGLRNLEYTRTTPVSTPCGPGELVVVQDVQGRKVSEVNWCEGRRCGLAKIYKNGELVKIIDFYRDLILSYRSYENGVLVTEISGDRTRIVNQGRQIVPVWDKVYIPTGNKELVILNKKQVIDLLSLVAIPEEIATFFDGLNEAARSSLGGERSMFPCGGKVKSIKDVEVNLKSTNASTKSSAFNDIKTSVSSCTASLESFNSNGLSGSAGVSAQQGRIDQANTNIDKTIATCANGDKNSLIADPEDEMWQQARPYMGPALAGLKAAAQNAERTQMIVRGTNIAFNAAKVAYLGGEAAVTTTAGGGAVGGGAAAGASIGLLPAIGILAAAAAIGLIVNYGVETAIEAHFDAKDAADDAAQQQALQAAPKPAAGTAPSGHTDPVKTPLPGGSEGGKNCDKLKGIKDRCNANGWKGWDCQEALNFFGGKCNAYDIREVITSENGDFVGGNCSDFSAADKAKLECKKMGMIAMPGDKGFLCNNRKPIVDLAGLLHKSWYTDPMPVDANSFRRGNVSKMFSSKTGINTFDEITTVKLNDILRSTLKPTLVVFMDPDCPSCKTFSSSLLSKEVAETMAKGIDIIVIDASANSELITKYDIIGYPSYFLKKANGANTPIAIGSLSPNATVQFMLTK